MKSRPRHRWLVTAVAIAATVLAIFWVPTAAGAAPEPSTPCNFQGSATCQSTDPVVSVSIDYYGDAAHCTFVWFVEWGDGNNANVVVTDPADGWVLLTRHTYTTPRTYTISITGDVSNGDCMANGFSRTFTLLSPAPVPVPVGPPSPPTKPAAIHGSVCVFNDPTGASFTLPGGVLIFGHVAWGFELTNGSWEYGANEGPAGGLIGNLSETWHFNGTKAQMIAEFRSGGIYHTPYTQYRCANVTTTNAGIKAAEARVLRESLERYAIPGQDCESQVYNVLAAYGVKGLPSDLTEERPDHWFSDLSSAGFGHITKLH